MPIMTNKPEKKLSDALLAAGDKQERDVAFYLRREFSSDDDFFVFNDLLVNHNGESAQIDHLILHRLGFTILESKSISGEVKVNELGEWSRSYNGKWSGIPSPLNQAEMQMTLLRGLLCSRAKEYLGKIVGLQRNVGGQKWGSFCVVSNNCILHRDKMPKDINDRVIKSESIAKLVRPLAKKRAWLIDSVPVFSDKEMSCIANFILNEIHNKRSSDKQSFKESKAANARLIKCKKCGEQEEITGKSGKFGYYIHCMACNANTSMKTPCLRCGNPHVRISKRRNEYLLECSCSEPYLLFS